MFLPFYRIFILPESSTYREPKSDLERNSKRGQIFSCNKMAEAARGGGGRGGSRQPVHACHRAVQPRPSSESKIVCGRRLVRRWNKDIEGRDSHLLKITIDQEEKKQPDVPGSVVINNGGPHWAMCPAAKSVPQSQHAPSVRPGIASQKSSGHLGALVDDGPSQPGTQAAGDCPSPKAVFPKGLGSRPSQHPSGLAGCSLS